MHGLGGGGGEGVLKLLETRFDAFPKAVEFSPAGKLKQVRDGVATWDTRDVPTTCIL